MPDRLFKKAKYKRGKSKIPRKKAGIIDKVKSAFNQNTSKSKSSTNRTVSPPLSNTSSSTKPATSTSSSTSSSSSSTRRPTTPTPTTSTTTPTPWFNDENQSTAMNSGTNQFLQDIASGNLNLQSVRGGYEHDASLPGGSSFVQDATGRPFLQYTDASGNVVQGNRNQSRGYNTPGRSLQALPIPQETLTKDPWGQNVKTIDQVTSMFADKRGYQPHTDQRRQYEQNLNQQIRNYSLANQAYRRNFDYNATIGQIGTTVDSAGNVVEPNNYRAGLPTGVTWGDGSPTDLSQIDRLRGGTGEPFYMDTRNLMHRQGRMVPTGNTTMAGEPEMGWRYEGNRTYDASNPDPFPNIPIENFYWENPLGKSAPTTPMAGVGVQGRPWSELKEEEKEELNRARQNMERQEWYKGAVHQNFKQDNPELKYDYNASDPWAVTDIGKYQGVTNASNQFSMYK